MNFKFTKLPLALFCFSCLLLVGCGADDDDGGMSSNELDEQLNALLLDIAPQGLSEFRLPESSDYAAIPQDPLNPITPVKVLLGKLLFHETGIALNPMVDDAEGSFSCASCHFAEAGFQANRIQGIGEGGEGFFNRTPSADFLDAEFDVQPIRTPAALNTAYQDVMLWNGQFGGTGTNAGTEDRWTPETPIANNELGFQGIETQAIAGLTVHRLVIDDDFISENNYTNLFEAAFPQLPAEDRISTETAGLAIAAYERTLLANRSPWQLWLRGQQGMMSDDEKRGALLFFGEAGCYSCHSGPSLASMSFHAIGMDDLDRCIEPTINTRPDNTENMGRGGFTGVESDMFRFKTPQLYNLTDSPFYGHGSSLFSVEDVVRYKNDAVSQNDRVPTSALSPDFQPLNLDETEIAQLTLFLEESLHDPDLLRYVPQAVLSGNCFPNNDPDSQVDRGCN